MNSRERITADLEARESNLEPIELGDIPDIAKEEYAALRQAEWLPEAIKAIPESDEKHYNFVVERLIDRLRKAKLRELLRAVHNHEIETEELDELKDEPIHEFASEFSSSLPDIVDAAEFEYYRLKLETELQRSPFGDVLNKRGIEQKFKDNDFEDKKIAFITFDLDGFKAVNDNKGHEVGDIVLRAFAETLHEQTKLERDFPIHFSGDEFGVVMTINDAELQKAGKPIEQIISEFVGRLERRALERLPELYKQIMGADKEFPSDTNIALSTGFIVADKGKPKNFTELRQTADDAVEVSKLLGQTDANPASEQRVVPANNADAVLERNGVEKSQILELSLKRNLKRGAESYAKMTDQDPMDVLSGLVDCILKKNA